MAKQPRASRNEYQSQPLPEGEALTGDDGAKTHLLVRAKKKEGFRRAGLRFTASHSALSIADLGPDRLKLLEDEPMLSTTRITAFEAERYAEGELTALDENTTKSQLFQALVASEARRKVAEEELAELRAKVAGVDYAPKAGDLIPGQ